MVWSTNDVVDRTVFKRWDLTSANLLKPYGEQTIHSDPEMSKVILSSATIYGTLAITAVNNAEVEAGLIASTGLVKSPYAYYDDITDFRYQTEYIESIPASGLRSGPWMYSGLFNGANRTGWSIALNGSRTTLVIPSKRLSQGGVISKIECSFSTDISLSSRIGTCELMRGEKVLTTSTSGTSGALNLIETTYCDHVVDKSDGDAYWINITTGRNTTTAVCVLTKVDIYYSSFGKPEWIDGD